MNPTRYFRRIRHRLAHRLGCHTGTVEVFYIGTELHACFVCNGCHRLGDVHRVEESVPVSLF